MLLGHSLLLAEAIAAAVLVENPTWTVEVVLDALIANDKLPVGDAVLLMITPVTHKAERREGSRYGIESELLLDFRLRTRLGSADKVALNAAKVVAWDRVGAILIQRESFELTGVGKATWVEGLVVDDPVSTRKDRLISKVASTLFHLFWNSR